MQAAASQGDLAVLQLAYSEGITWDIGKSITAARDNTEVVAWLGTLIN
jgi:hypothetical protein